VTTGTIPTTPEHTTPTYSNHLSVNQWIRSAIRDSQQPISPFPIFETSATALCGTTGIMFNGNHTEEREINNGRFNDVYPTPRQRISFAKTLQNMFVSILQARDKQKKMMPPDGNEQEESMSEEHQELTIQQVNPCAFSKNELFPTYPWEWDYENPADQKFFKGQIPDNWRRFAGNAEWSYSLDLFPALVWYFRQLVWPETASDYAVTWAEIAIDFQAATHCVLQRDTEQSLTLEQQARLLRAATKRISQICSAKAVPNLDTKVSVPILNALGLGRAAGLPLRPRFLQIAQVHKVLFAAAMHPDAKKPAHKRSFVPDLSSLPKPLWAGPGCRRMRGKQTPVEDVSLPSQKRNSTSHKALTQSIQWSPDEQMELNEARDWRHRQRLEKRILHNRTAKQLGRHVLAPFDEKEDLKCMVCQKTIGIGNLSRFTREKCGGQQDLAGGVHYGTARASVTVSQRASWAQTHNESVLANRSNLHIFSIPTSIDDELRCTVCNATHNENWRRFGKLARKQCPLSTL